MIKMTALGAAIVGIVMLKRGWMNRYLPRIAIETVPDVAVVFGYVWSGLMFFSAALNVALALKYDDPPAPITESQLLAPRRCDDNRPDLWSVFNRTQENLVQGGLLGRAANGRRQRTRPVQGIDQNVRLNRALWLLADGIQRLKA